MSRASPSAFLVLAFALALPFWLLGATSSLQLLPGLPVAALATGCPALAAVILVYRREGGAGVAALLRRSFDLGRIRSKVWYLPTLMLMPLVMLASFGVLRLIGTAVPAPVISPLRALVLGVVFFAAALGEELGWSGYATDPLRARFGALGAGLVLGAIWALYHYVALAEAHRPLAWVAWWTLATVALRVIMVWLYENTGESVFAAALFHMTINVTWQLFPVRGSYYDPRVTGLILAVVAAVIVVVWGPRALVRVPTVGTR